MIDNEYVEELVTAIVDFRGDEDTFIVLLKEKLAPIIRINEREFAFVDVEDHDIKEEYDDENDDFAYFNWMDEDFVEGADEVVEYDLNEDLKSEEAIEDAWKQVKKWDEELILRKKDYELKIAEEKRKKADEERKKIEEERKQALAVNRSIKDFFVKVSSINKPSTK